MVGGFWGKLLKNIQIYSKMIAKQNEIGFFLF
jgi:hypothetical protein